MRFCLAATLLILVSFAAFAQDPPAERKKLIVFTKPVKPFVFEQGGIQVGYSIDLWRRIAQEARLEFEFQSKATVPEVMDGLVQGGADAGVGAFSITAEREQMLDFSHPFYESGLQILVLSTGESSTFAAFAALFQPGTLIVLGLLVVALLVNSHILWWFERRKNAESFPEDYKQGMFEALWWNMSTLITAGCENKSPTGLIGRLAAIGWMIASIATVAYITATLSAALTVSTLTSDVRSVSDLIGKQVGTVAASAAEKSLKARGLDVRGYDSVEQACNALLNGEVKAVIYDQPLLRYFLATHPGIKLQLVGDVFERQDYGIPLRQNSPYRKAINTALLKLSEENYFVELNRKWFAGSSQ